MKLKDRAKKAFKLYFVLFTLITMLMLILGLIFDADRAFGYQVFISPAIYALIGIIPVLLFVQDKELSVKRLVISRILELVLIEAIVMLIAFSADTIPTEKIGMVIGLAVGIAAIYGLTFLFEYIHEVIESKELNEKLQSFQNNQKA